MPVKYVFVTGRRCVRPWKRHHSSSLGRLLKARGYKVTMQKFDPYINIDPGTMNPLQLVKCSLPMTVRKLIWILATTSVSLMKV